MSIVSYGATLAEVKQYLPSFISTNADHSALDAITDQWIPSAAAQVNQALYSGGYSPSEIVEATYPVAYQSLQHVICKGAVCLYLNAVSNQVTGDFGKQVCDWFDKALADIRNGKYLGELPSSQSQADVEWSHGDETTAEMDAQRFSYDIKF